MNFKGSCSLIITLTYFLIILLNACAVWSQGTGVGNCWLDAAEVAETSLNFEIVPQNVTKSDGGISWNLVTRVTWQRPSGMMPEDMYTIRLNSFDGTMVSMGGESVMTDPCTVNPDEIFVSTEEYVFHNLSFGQLYEFEIHLFRPGRQQKSIQGTVAAFETPGCFHATGDREFCLSRVHVEHAAAPIEPQVNNLCRNSSTGLLRVSLSWLPPLKVNGHIFVYSVSYGVVVTPAPDVTGEGPALSLNTVNVFPSVQNNSNHTDPKLSTNLQGLDEGKLYYVRITPVVDSPSDGNKYPGNDVELTFLTANWTDPTGETTEINLATPPCDIFDDVTILTSTNATEEEEESRVTTILTTIADDESTATPTTPVKYPPSKMAPKHIALIAVFTILIVSVVIVFIVITVKMTKKGQTSKLPQFTGLPAMLRRHKSSDDKKKDLSMAEKGAKPKSEEKTKPKEKSIKPKS